jgi:hypothetical protein
MQVDTRQLESLRAQGERVYRRASEVLRSDRSTVGRLKWEQGIVVRDQSGVPVNARATLGATLKQKQRELFDQMECDPLLPRKVHDRLAETVDRLGIWAKCDPILAAWVDLICSSHVATFAAKEGESRAATAEISDRRANLTSLSLRYVRDLGIPVFVPSPGNVFLAVRLTDLRLRCLAALCRSKYKNFICSLYDRFGSGEDPIRRVARQFYRGRVSWSKTDKEFDYLQHTLPEEYARWIRLARGVLETLPLGLPAALSLQLLKTEFGLEGIGILDWEKFTAIIFNGAVAEMQPFLFYDIAETLAKNLEVPEEVVREHLEVGQLNPENRRRHDPAQSKVQSDLVRRRATPLVRDLLHQSESMRGPGDARASDADADLLKIAEKSVGGRITSRWFPAEVRRQEWFFLIDDVVKLFGHALVRNGFRLVGIVEDEVLLEVPSSRANPSTTEEIGALCQEATRELLGAASPPCQFSWQASWPTSTKTGDSS